MPMPVALPDPVAHAAALSAPDRLAAVRDSGLADSPPEEAFDRFTRLVQRCLQVPISLVSIIDAERQFFKSQQGLPEPWCSIRETPISHSVCQHVVVRDAPLVVEDARSHPLVHDNPAVLNHNVVGYLGVPLRTPDGLTVGSLCAIDAVPRAWTESDRDVMEALAEAVMAEIATRHRLQARADGFGSSLSLADALFRAVFEGAPDPMAVLRSDGVVAEANRAVLTFVGRARETVVGQPLWDVLSVDTDRLRQAVDRAVDGEGADYTEAVQDTSGAIHDLRLGVQRVRGAGGLLLFEARGAAVS